MWGILLIVILIVAFYFIYLKDYFEVKKIFKLLSKTLDTRDLLAMKLVPEIKNKNEKAEIIQLIELRMKNKNSGYTEQMKLDVKLNEKLKKVYFDLEKSADNILIKSVVTNILEIEHKLKKIREEYNTVVEKYNMNLVMNKFVCVKLIHMKPLDKYTTN